jgi:hypothetical protein
MSLKTYYTLVTNLFNLLVLALLNVGLLLMRLKSHPPFEPKLKLLWDGAIITLAITSKTEQSEQKPAAFHSKQMLKLRLVEPALLQQLLAMPHPLDYQCTVRDPSIRHLVELLQAEVKTSQPLNQVVISSIAIVLATYLLQHWQTGGSVSRV